MEADGLQFQLLLSVSVRIHGEGEGGRGRRGEVRGEGGREGERGGGREGGRGEGVVRRGREGIRGLVRGRREKGRRSETEGGREGERGLLKDFCVHVHVYHEHYVILFTVYLQTSFEFREWDSRRPLHTNPSLDFLAPEYILSRSCSEKSDIYSFGMLCYAVYNGGRPLCSSLDNLLSFKQNMETVSGFSRCRTSIFLILFATHAFLDV